MLNSGMTNAMSRDAMPEASAPKSEAETGTPNRTKLLRKMPWINTPRRAFSFSKRHTAPKESANESSTDATANAVKPGWNAVEISVE